MTRRVGLVLLPLVCLITSGCATERHSPESALNPAGPQAARIGSLLWLIIWICVVVYVAVVVMMIGAVLHRRRGQTMGPTNDPVLKPEPARERRIWWTVSGAVSLTIVTLFVLLITDFATGRSIHHFSQESSDRLVIKVTARQWWWEVRYDDWPERFGERAAYNNVTTANEIHVPVDPDHPVLVEVRLDSADVIHSFWVPNLHGKRDLIPGHPTAIYFRADKPGVYWGECAEYCGYQHAQMRLVVVAEPADQFNAWLQQQRQPAPEPLNEQQARGKNVFLHSTCAFCHSIQGTEAYGKIAPDLTHVASRKILAAGAVPNTPGHLAGWIMDPQSIKPGTRMPQNNLTPGDLRALLEYLETLK